MIWSEYINLVRIGRARGPSRQRTNSGRGSAHTLWVLVCEKCEERCEGAEPSSEHDEEGQLLLGVH